MLFWEHVKSFHLKLINGYFIILYKEAIAPLKHKRHSCLAATVGDHLMVMGGYKGQGMRSNDIELYI